MAAFSANENSLAHGVEIIPIEDSEGPPNLCSCRDQFIAMAKGLPADQIVRLIEFGCDLLRCHSVEGLSLKSGMCICLQILILSK